MSDYSLFSNLWLKIAIMIVCGLYFAFYYIVKDDDNG